MRSSPPHPRGDAPSTRGELLRGLRDALPVMAGFVPFGFVLGAQAAQKDLPALLVTLMTASNYAGGSEFAAVALWTSPPAILLIAAVTLLVNSRHLIMSAVLTPMLRHLPRRRVLPLLFFMCDESWALGLADARRRLESGVRVQDAFSVPYYMAGALALYATWVTSSTAGALIGPLLGDLRAWGFHMAFPAVFLVILRGMWKGMAAARPWLVSLLVAVGTHLLVPGAWYVVTGALAGLVAALLLPDGEAGEEAA